MKAVADEDDDVGGATLRRCRDDCAKYLTCRCRVLTLLTRLGIEHGSEEVGKSVVTFAFDRQTMEQEVHETSVSVPRSDTVELIRVGSTEPRDASSCHANMYRC
jgi:hypothetical protein